MTTSTLTLSHVITADQLACLTADMNANNANGSNANGEQFTDVALYLAYLVQNHMPNAYASMSALYNIPITDFPITPAGGSWPAPSQFD